MDETGCRWLDPEMTSVDAEHPKTAAWRKIMAALPAFRASVCHGESATVNSNLHLVHKYRDQRGKKPHAIPRRASRETIPLPTRYLPHLEPLLPKRTVEFAAALCESGDGAAEEAPPLPPSPSSPDMKAIQFCL